MLHAHAPVLTERLWAVKSEGHGRDMCRWYADLVYRPLHPFPWMAMTRSHRVALVGSDTCTRGLLPQRGHVPEVTMLAIRKPQLELSSQASITRLTCLLPHLHVLLWEGCREESTQRAAITWTFALRGIFHAFYFSSNSVPNSSPFPCYSLFSKLMLHIQLCYPILLWPLFMQKISAFLYLFGWYLPSLLLPNLISDSSCLFRVHALCLFSTLFARLHLSAL